MKKSTLFAGAFGLMFLAGSFQAKAEAEIPVVAVSVSTLIDNPTVSIIEDAKFNQMTGYIGNCSASTVVSLGQVDFGDGDALKAASIDLANGWYVDGWAILHAGSSWEDSMPFCQIAINETGGYDNFYLYASNFTCNQGDDPSNWSGFGSAFADLEFQIEYVKPVGKQNVYLSFVGGSGNIRSINFYANELQAENFITNEESYDYMMRLLQPNEYESYYDNVIHRTALESVAYNGDEYPDTRIDTENESAENSWGWTTEGFIADFGDFDFGEGGWEQVAIRFTHWSSNIRDYVDIYIDEVAKENHIANFWTGRDLGNSSFIYLAENITKNLTGTHKVLCRWTGGSTNIQCIDFCKKAVWPIANNCYLVIQDYEQSEDAFHMTFINCPFGQGNPWAYEVHNNGQLDGAGNVGWTDNGTVLEFYDDGSNSYQGVDFGNGQYKTIVVNQSNPDTYTGPIEQYNFSFYLDLDPDLRYTIEDWQNDLEGILAGHEPIAVVYMQGTTDWGNRKRTAGSINTEVTGYHTLYMVYNGRGANVFDIWLDTKEIDGVQPIKVISTDNVYPSKGKININTNAAAAVEVYNMQGVRCSSAVVNGNASLDVAPGIYVVRVGSKSYKVAVK